MILSAGLLTSSKNCPYSLLIRAGQLHSGVKLQCAIKTEVGENQEYLL